jgi:glycosyltransferase involved in cell wall biosynthesis
MIAEESSKTSKRPRLSVIVPVHNGGLHLSRCLEGLAASAYDGFEVIVVDDCSTDNTRQIVERFGARYLRTAAPIGPGGARNLGVRHATGDIVVFVDADVVVPPDGLRLIAEELDRDLQLAALFGSYDTAPAWKDFLSQYKNLMHHYVHQRSDECAVTFWAGCGAMRRSVFEEFGGFNVERYREPSIEDIELGLRLTRAERKIRLEKRLQVKHLKRWTLRGLLRADIFRRAVPWTKLILETRNLPRDLNLTYAAQVSSLLIGFLLVVLLPLLLWSIAGGLEHLAARIAGVVACVLAALVALNWDVYAFFLRQRGWRFALGAMLAHWLYYLYSGVVFVVLFVEHVLRLPFRAAEARVENRRLQE